MPLTEISAFHPLVLIGMGLAIGIIYYVTKFGINSGAAAVNNGESKNSAQVIAIATDTKALDRATASVEALSNTLGKGTRISFEETDDMLRRIDDLTSSIKNLTFEIREHAKELRHKN